MGAIVTSYGAFHGSTCFGNSPNSLYRLCPDPVGWTLTIVGGFIVIGATVLFLKTRLMGHVRATESKKKEIATWSMAVFATGIALFFITNSAYQASAWQTYITKIPLHVEIEGLENEYKIGEEIEFSVTIEGYGYDCGFPNVLVWKYKPDNIMAENTVWQLTDGSESDNSRCSPFPVDVPKQTVRIGTSNETTPLVINETETYVAQVEGSIGLQFQVVDK